MEESRYCPHQNLRSTCKECRIAAIEQADVRAAQNRERGEAERHERMEEPALHYPWQRDAFEAWREGGRAGVVAVSLGVPVDDLPYAAVAHTVNANPGANVLVVCAPDQVDAVVQILEGRYARRVGRLAEHHFMEPRGDAQVVVADSEEMSMVDLPAWGRFATNGLLVLLNADDVGPHLGQLLTGAAFPTRFCLSRQPSAVDLLASRPWARGFGPLLYRFTEEQARDLRVLPRIEYRLHVEILKPEPGESQGPEGPWDPGDLPPRLGAVPAGQFTRGRARDVAARRAKEQDGLVVVHEGAPVPGAAATVALKNLPEKHAEPPSGWVLAAPEADQRAVLRLASTAWRTLEAPGRVEDVVVLPVPKDLCRVPPWDSRWRAAAVQVDRAVAGLLLAEKPGEAMSVDDLEALVGVALSLRGVPAEELYALSPVVAEAASVAHAGQEVPPERVREAARAYGGLASALLVAAEAGPMALLRLAHPRFTPGVPDLPHPSLYDARRHAWRGRAFSALSQAAGKGDLVTAWGRYPELRFVFHSSQLLESATSYCRRHRLKGPLDDAEVHAVEPRTRILDRGRDRDRAHAVLKEWRDALSVAERYEREFLADMHARQPERERRRQGVALPGLRVVDQGGDAVTLETEGGRLPATEITPGCEVALVEQGERREVARGVVSRMTARRVTVEFPRGPPPRQWPRAVTVNLVFDAKTFEAYHSAVLAAVRSLDTEKVQDESPDGLLRACLLGETPSGKQAPRSVDLPMLTASQREAVDRVLSGGRVHLVHGPPGTGKTHTLVHMAIALTRAGHSVLVTADSNAAVDNLVVGLRRAGAPVVRVAHAPNLRDEAAAPARIDPPDAPAFVRWAAGQGIVVATTNYGAYRYLDAKGSVSPFLFDYVVHDEAGQSTAPSSLAAVMRGRRLVLAGDPLQLPPTVVSLDAKEAGLDVTLFERIEELTGSGRTVLLRTQFRMREPIVSFSNRRYYQDRIETHPSAAEQEGLEDLPAVAFQHVTGKENPRQRSGSIGNDYEVDAVVHLVRTFQGALREKGWTVAVLTPYQAQREALRRALPEVEVSTVDGAQGREWDVVFYSSVRSNPQHRLGFLSDERRLNVAVTRARRNFVLVGDERTLQDHPAFKELLDHAAKVRLFYPERHGSRPPPVGTRERGAPKRARRGRAGRPASQQPAPQQQGEGAGGRRRRRRRRRGKRSQDGAAEGGDGAGGEARSGAREEEREGGAASGGRRRGRRGGRRQDGGGGPARDRPKARRDRGAKEASGDGGRGGKAAGGKAAGAVKARRRCTAKTQKGDQCRNPAREGRDVCARHA